MGQLSKAVHVLRGPVVWAGVVLLCLFTAGGLSAKTVTDQLGRTLHVPDSPMRVIALAPNITEIVFFLGEQNRLVGVSQYSDYPEAARQIPEVGSYITPDLERIVALRPDLCIATKDGNPKALVERLQEFNIPVYAVNPQSLAGMLDTVTDIGSLLGAKDRARMLTAQLSARIDRIDRLTATADHRPEVFFQIGISPIVSAGAGTFLHELMARAGGKNLAGSLTGYPRFTREQVISMAPEVIIITSMARGALFEEVRAGWLQWKNMPAAQNDRVYVQDTNLLDRVGPRLVDGLELLAELIHPELFGDTP